jgi:hypothetical protein
MGQLAALVSPAYRPLSFERGQEFARTFTKDMVLVMNNFFESWAFDLIAGEANRLAAQAIRRDLFMEESGSWRHMATLGSEALCRISSIVPYLYRCEDLASFLSGVADERVLPVPDRNEQFVLNCLTREGDHHGAHLDTYSFALNLIIETPPAGRGGVAKITGTKDQNPTVRFTEKEIPLKAGDVYFMRTNEAVHAVSPIKSNCRRVMFNFAYRSGADAASTSYSSSKLYA